MLSCFSCARSPATLDGEGTHDALKSRFNKSLSLNDGRLIVHGVFAKADTHNNNKRVYPKAILKAAVAKFEQQHVRRGTALGELDHPSYASRYFQCLNLANISHQVLDVSWRGNELWGSIEVLRTPSGLLLWELFSQGVRLGVSSRGWASLLTRPNDDSLYIDDDFQLVTFDFVTEPSTAGAFLQPYCKAYRYDVPDQSKHVKIAQLGYGVVAMEHVGRLPDPAVLAKHITIMHQESLPAQGAATLPEGDGTASVHSLRVAEGTTGGGGATAAVESNKRSVSGLDRLLKYSHYIVHKEASFLDIEPNAREYDAHVAMFAVRAHLAQQRAALTADSDLASAVLQELGLGGDAPPVFDQPSNEKAAAAPNYSRHSSIDLPASVQKYSSVCADLPSLLPTADVNVGSSDGVASWSYYPNALYTAPASHSASRRSSGGGSGGGGSSGGGSQHGPLEDDRGSSGGGAGGWNPLFSNSPMPATNSGGGAAAGGAPAFPTIAESPLTPQRVEGGTPRIDGSPVRDGVHGPPAPHTASLGKSDADSFAGYSAPVQLGSGGGGTDVSFPDHTSRLRISTRRDGSEATAQQQQQQQAAAGKVMDVAMNSRHRTSAGGSVGSYGTGVHATEKVTIPSDVLMEVQRVKMTLAKYRQQNQAGHASVDVK